MRTASTQWFASVHGGNVGNRPYGVPKPASVVPKHLRTGLGVTETTRLTRSLYFSERLAANLRSVLSEGDAWGRLRRASRAIPATRGQDRISPSVSRVFIVHPFVQQYRYSLYERLTGELG